MTRVTRLVFVLILNLVLIVGLIVVGITAHSLGVLAAGGDYLADAAAIGVSLLAIGLSNRPPSVHRPDGYPRATAVAALTNGLLLLVVVAFVIVEAMRRLVGGTDHVHGLPVLVASAIAAIVMLIGAVILNGDAEDAEDTEGDRANMRAVLLDTVADAAAAAGVAVTGTVILISGGLYWLDPAVALVIATVIGYHVMALLRDTAPALRRTPRDARPIS
jgi:cobalt-zinc-cadmium efflux system protein